jgi:hypothetical protein
MLKNSVGDARVEGVIRKRQRRCIADKACGQSATACLASVGLPSLDHRGEAGDFGNGQRVVAGPTADIQVTLAESRPDQLADATLVVSEKRLASKQIEISPRQAFS